MKKKILFVSEALWIGGIETALVNLLNRMDYEKYDVTLLLRRAVFDGDLRQRIPVQCPILTFDREDGRYRYAWLYHLTEESVHPSRLHRAMMWAVPAIKWIENRLYIRYIRSRMKNEHFDTCVIYSDVASETAVRAIRADKFLLFYHHGAMRRVWHDEIAYQKADNIITVSAAVEEKLRKFRAKYADKMLTIHNLVDVEGIRRSAGEFVPEEFAAYKFNIVSCGRVSYEKGMDLAVEACAELVGMGHTKIHWWIVGGGPAENKVGEKIAQLSMGSYVTMLGMKGNPYPYIKAADLYVQPSRFEAYGLTIAEALALGKQIVATDTDGAKELIRDGENGTLCASDGQSISWAVNAAMGFPKVEKDDSAEIESRNQMIVSQIDSVIW